MASNFRVTVPLGVNIAAARENAANEYEWLTGREKRDSPSRGRQGASFKKELSEEMSSLETGGQL